MALKWSKIKMSKKIFFCSFYVIMSLHAKNCVCRSNGLACGQYKDKEEKNYSGPCIGDHLLRATTCLRDHFCGPPVVFYYILHLLRATTCLTRPRPPILRVRRPFFPVKATTFPRKKLQISPITFAIIIGDHKRHAGHEHWRPQTALRPVPVLIAIK